VGIDLRSPRSACLAREPVALESLGTGPLHSTFVLLVEADVETHPNRQGPQAPLARRDNQHRQDGHRVVQDPGGTRLGRMRSVEEPHGGGNAEVMVPDAEPQVVVDVDQYPSGPHTDGSQTERRCQERRCRGREEDVVSDAHEGIAQLMLTPVTAGR
jgi:hypothetical protein